MFRCVMFRYVVFRCVTLCCAGLIYLCCTVPTTVHVIVLIKIKCSNKQNIEKIFEQGDPLQHYIC